MTTLEAARHVALSRILFATDFSPQSTTVLRYASAVAQLYGGTVYGTHIVPSEDYIFSAPDLWPSHMQKDTQLQQEVTARIDDQLREIPHKVLFGFGEIWGQMSSLIEKNDIDLVVMGTHGRTGARKLLMGSVAESVFRQATCPVLSVGPNVKPGEGVQFENILLAEDFRQGSLAALPFAISFAEHGRGQLTLLHVVTQSPADAPIEEVRTSMKRRLSQLVPLEPNPQFRVEYQVQFTQEPASADLILDTARNQRADLIVLGVRPTHAAVSTVTHWGHTTAQRVVAHAHCPVLTVAPECNKLG